MATYKFFDPYAIAAPKIEIRPMPPAKLAKVAKVETPNALAGLATLAGLSDGIQDKSGPQASRNYWNAQDWLAYYHERAGIAEDNGLVRDQANARALESCVTEWLNRNVIGAPAGYCARCGDNNSPDNPLQPFGAEPSGHTWLHAGCWRPWFDCRRAEAATALAALGIRAPQGDVP